MKKLVSLLLALVFALSVGAVAYADTPDAVNDARDGVGFLYEKIEKMNADGVVIGEMGGVSSGFFVGEKNKDPQYFVTCYHCVEMYDEYGKGALVTDGEAYYKGVLHIYFDKDDYVEAYLEEYDANDDIAILRLSKPTDKREAMVLIEPTDKMVSKQIYALGYPASADVTDPTDYWSKTSISITNGLVSRLVEESGTGVRKIQVDAKISSGNSGGAIINSKGQVMGVVSHGISGEIYAISAAEVIDMCDKLGVKIAVAGSTNLLPIILIAAGILLIGGLVVLIVVLTSKKGGKGAAQGGKGGRMIVGQAGALAGRTYVLKPGQKMMVGRNTDCHICFPADTKGVSKVHCSIVFDGEKVFVRDEGSSMGTYIGDTKVEPNKTVSLHRGQPLYVGSKAQILVLRSK